MSPRARVRREATAAAYQPLTWAIDSLADPSPALPGTAAAPFRAPELALPLALAGVLGTVAFRHGPRIVDDAYVTFRYARNLADGAGLVYNAGEAVLGTSAPLFAVLLAGLHAATGAAIPSLAFGIGVLALPGAALVGYRLARRVAGPVLSALFVLAALSPQASLEVFASGMETPLYLLGLLGAAELLARGRSAAAFLVAGALFFVHPDALALVPALLAALLVSKGPRPWRALALGLAPAALGAALLAVRYGSPVPHSVTAKRAAYAMPPLHALSQLSETVVDVVVARETPAPAAVGLLVALVALGLIVLTGRRALRAPAVGALGIFAALLLGAFALANPLVFDWYRPPLALACALVVTACAARLTRPGRAAAAAVLAAAAAIHLAAFRPYDPSGREEVYARAAGLLNLGASETVAAPEIGALGWATRARVLDTTGLVSPEALRWLDRPLGEGGAVPPRLLRETDAQALVSLDRFLEPARAADPEAFGRWTEVARLPAHAFGGSGAVLVFRNAR